MNNLFSVWIIGMEISLIWINLVYGWVAFKGDSFLLAVIHLAIVCLVIFFSLNGVLQKFADRFKPLSFRVILLTKGTLALFFLSRWLLLAKIKGIIATGDKMTDANIFAVGSSFVILVIFLVYELYLISKKA